MSKETVPSMPSWVDRMRMVPLPDRDRSSVSSAAPKKSTAPNSARDNDAGDQPLEFNIASLNVLAESYLTPRSHPGLPESYAEVAFDAPKRRQLLLDTLKRFCSPTNKSDDDAKNTKWDILALQELDLVQPEDPILPAFDSWGYQVVRTPSDDRKDCSAIAFDTTKFSLVKYEVVKFDDLATLQNNNEDTTTTKVEDGVDNNTRKGKKDVNFHNITPKRSTTPPELTGMVRSFLRRNCGIVAHLKSKQTGQSLIVASVHLYWHPGYEYVKLCQAKYLLDRVAEFALDGKNVNGGASSSDRVPTIICGDMNSKPGSIVHKLFVEPNVDARTVAPWRYFWDQDNEEMYTEEDDNDISDDSNDTGGDRKDGQDPIVSAAPVGKYDGAESEKKEDEGGYVMSGLSADFSSMYCGTIDSNTESNKDEPNNDSNVKNEASETNPDKGDNMNMKSENSETNSPEKDNFLAWRRINKYNTPQDYRHSLPPLSVKYHLDYTLNRFTRWLRILGIDATLETMEEEKKRTVAVRCKGGNIALFDHCKNEQRTLLTTSYKLLLRKDCPPGAYLLDPKCTSDLELALPRLLRTHGIQLSPCTFLTRCVVCNGHINRVSSDEDKRAVFVEHGAPGLVQKGMGMEVFRCDSCSQGYWWDDRPSSSASRVFSQATKLLRLCLRGGVALNDETITDEKKWKVIMGAFDFVDVAKERQNEELTREAELSVIEWLREDKLSSAFKLRSAYAAAGGIAREHLPFTNVTSEFVGCLDYIFFELTQFDQICKLNVPKSFRDMNASGSYQGHLIPSDIWPSDHIAVGARLRLKQSKIADGGKEDDMTSKATLPNEKTNGNNNKRGTHEGANPRCACGCVPNILSLFEMAELRKKYREKKAAEAAAAAKL